MNVTFTPEPIPEVMLEGRQLTALSFTAGTPLQLMLRPDGPWITTVTDEAVWEQLCEAS